MQRKLTTRGAIHKNSISLQKAVSCRQNTNTTENTKTKESLSQYTLENWQYWSKDDSSIMSCLRLPELLCKESERSTTAYTSDQQRSDHRDRRCDSVGDLGTSRGSGSMAAEDMIPKPKPEPIFIAIDFSRVQPPKEHAVAAAAKVVKI